MMKQPELGRKIVELRQQKGFTQEELVEQCNISVRTIQRIEAGEVSPRIYTIKTILAALDRDLDDLQQNSVFETKVKEAMLLEIDPSKDVSFLFKQLNVGWITGIISMICFVFQFIEDSYYISEGDYYFGGIFYITLGIVSIVMFALHMRAFVLIGELFKSYFLKVVSILFIAVNTLMILYSIMDMYFKYVPEAAYAIIFCVFYGLMYLFFGYALLKLKGLGQLPKATGLMQIVIGGMFLTIIFSIVASPASILVQGLNVAIILKVIETIKAQVDS
ncbi:helix-turn-helix transcriptional regulator [uncultured Dokdonia sp.]|uniref:helix-turn-helix domain-containing protein n=1 Tax=uncultured Dokdonia sp. TaxID=575653 RepID=UPI0026145E17|nr:helix-turn-helix transcriptional regulator [uncultured Dokdonia sp.]